MAALPQTLIEAVRRRLWLGQFLAAARLALWGTAGLMLLTVAFAEAGSFDFEEMRQHVLAKGK